MPDFSTKNFLRNSLPCIYLTILVHKAVALARTRGKNFVRKSFLVFSILVLKAVNLGS